MDTLTPAMKMFLAAGVLYGVWKYGPAWAKGLAIGAGGFMVANQIPVVRDGLVARAA